MTASQKAKARVERILYSLIFEQTRFLSRQEEEANWQARETLVRILRDWSA